MLVRNLGILFSMTCVLVAADENIFALNNSTTALGRSTPETVPPVSIIEGRASVNTVSNEVQQGVVKTGDVVAEEDVESQTLEVRDSGAAQVLPIIHADTPTSSTLNSNHPYLSMTPTQRQEAYKLFLASQNRQTTPVRTPAQQQQQHAYGSAQPEMHHGQDFYPKQQYYGYHMAGDHRPISSYNKLDLLYHTKDSQRQRPTLQNLDPADAVKVNTPEELLEHCCRFPACYDPLYELCIDTCRKCETVYPVTSWLPCPPLLNIPDCTSDSLSRLGRLPLACYPDIGPFANIMPVSSVMKVSSFYVDPVTGLKPSNVQLRGRVKDGSRVDYDDGDFPSYGSQKEQLYRKAMQSRNRKKCNEEGLCHSNGKSFTTTEFGRGGRS